MIKAKIRAQHTDTNLRSYEQTCKSFSWSDVKKMFTWHGTGKINIVHEAIDRWADDPARQGRTALIFEKAGEVRTYSYLELKKISCQWANLLLKYGFKTGDRLFIFLPSCPEAYFVMLACARLGVLFCPLFSTLSFDELEDRLENAEPRGILTHPDLSEDLPCEAMKGVEHIFLTQGPLPGLFPGEVLLQELSDKMPAQFSPRWFPGNTPLYLLYTSGSTGPPKGVVHAHHDMLGHLVTARFVLDLREESILWTDCEPAWVTGTVYGAFGPWLCGAASVVQGDPFSASNWYRTLEKHQVSVWYTTPGTIRRLIEAGEDLAGRYDFSHLRHISAVGDAMAPELIYWIKKNLKLSPHDTWWMTETGMICLANFPCMDIKPGSMGKPVPGIEAAVIDEKGKPLPDLTMGELALKLGWPSMMTDIWQDKKRYQEYFSPEGWFLTGDMVIKDEDGYFYHQGRIDDLIKAGVKLIGPYEIERALYRHPAVGEAAVISRSAKPGESFLKAFITTNKGFSPSARLNREIRAFVKANLSSDIALREIAFLEEIPKTRSGKLLRRVLRARELGLPVGDPLKMK
ncbi:AMP-binding protein [Desulfonema magnum]|uniref:acetate--CoA ligase n=1 Tax=Desulfonema magnum TaxID=45655 RepID=A0A975BWN1_9BACT|nr:AMP-binding protein [Desulfonema magnum]QTA92500.1 AMP-binding enzyme [Desulfonema magnum]